MTPTPAQLRWLEAFAAVPGCYARVLYSDEFDELLAALEVKP